MKKSSYDEVGNMTVSQNGSGTSNYTVNNANQLTAKTGVGARSFTYDNQGNQITDTGKTYAYSYDNQLKQLVNGSTTTNYTYDANGNRLDKTQTGTGATNYQYVNTGNDTVLQAKNLTASTNQYYLYGSGQISQGDTASSSRQYPVTDGMGNVKYLTSSTGTTAATYAYDPYGKQISGSTTASNYMFQGEQKDAESGLTYLRARYYDPTIGRFTTQDPLSGTLGDPAGQNGYNYANDDPINLSDPTGLSVWSAFKDITGLTTYENNIAMGCDKGSIITSGLSAASNLAIFIPGLGEADLAAQGALRGGVAFSKVANVEKAAKVAVNGETSATKYGKEMHAAWDYGDGFVKEFVLKPTNKRVDGINFTDKVVAELKPNNPRQIKAGEKQLESYLEILNKEYGGGWTSRLDTYDK